MGSGSLPSAHRCGDHGSLLGLRLGYCEGLQVGQRVIVPTSPTPLLPSASTSKVSASCWHVLHWVVWMLPGDISVWSVSSIAVCVCLFVEFGLVLFCCQEYDSVVSSGVEACVVVGAD